MKMTLTALSVLILAAAPLAAQQTPAAPGEPVNFVEQQTQSEVLATDFTGETVLSSSGEKVGDVNNLVFDENGRISLVVIGVGGFLGVGQKEVAVPFAGLKPEMRDNQQVLIIDATKEQLQAAPAYKTLNDQKFNERLTNWREKAKASWDQVSNRAKEAYQDAKGAVQDAGDKAQDATENAADQASDAAKDAQDAPDTAPAQPPRTN